MRPIGETFSPPAIAVDEGAGNLMMCTDASIGKLRQPRF